MKSKRVLRFSFEERGGLPLPPALPQVTGVAGVPSQPRGAASERVVTQALSVLILSSLKETSLLCYWELEINTASILVLFDLLSVVIGYKEICRWVVTKIFGDFENGLQRKPVHLGRSSGKRE